MRTTLNRLSSLRVLALAAAGLAAVTTAPTWAGPKLGPSAPATQIPAIQSEDALVRGEEATQQYVMKYGPLSLSVVVASVTGEYAVDTNPPAIVRAIAAEVESQLADYTGGFLVLNAQSLDAARAQRILERQNQVDEPSAAFIAEITELASTPYVLAIEVGPATKPGKSAGVVTLRLIEVATGRILVTIADQFWQDAQRYPEVPEAVWVQHSVTYWMEELMGRRAYPKAINGPHLASLQFVGDVPAGMNAKLKSILAEACGVAETAVNPRRSTQGFDVVTIDLLLPDPPHVVMDGLVQKIADGFADQDLNANPLRQVDGDLIFAVSRTPAWWTLTDKSIDAPGRQSWKELIQSTGRPAVAVVNYVDPGVAKSFAGEGRALSQALEDQLIASGLEVVGVEPVDQPFTRDEAGKALSKELRSRARWVCYVEIVPGLDPGNPKALARLVDLQADRVLGSSAFPAAAAAIPPGEAELDGLTHAARYLTGSLIADAVANPQAYQTLDVMVKGCPSFEFGNRIGNIVMAQPDVADVVLPSFDESESYTIEARYQGSPTRFAKRLRADLSTLPLQVAEFGEGQVVLQYTQ